MYRIKILYINHETEICEVFFCLAGGDFNLKLESKNFKFRVMREKLVTSCRRSTLNPAPIKYDSQDYCPIHRYLRLLKTNFRNARRL